MANNIEEIEQIRLSFPEYDDSIAKGTSVEQMIDRFPASIEKVTEWFKHYRVDSIELWISGVVKSGKILDLLVSAEGQGGMKIVLKQKEKEA